MKPAVDTVRGDSVGDAQTRDANHPAGGIDDGAGIIGSPQAAGAAGVPGAVDAVAGEGFQSLVVLDDVG